MIKNNYKCIIILREESCIMIDNIGNINQDSIKNLGSAKADRTKEVLGLKKNPYATYNRDFLIDESQISKDAIRMYQMEKDVKHFTKLAMSDIENDDTTDALMQKLFSKGVIDIDDENILGDLSQNNKFWNDLLG